MLPMSKIFKPQGILLVLIEHAFYRFALLGYISTIFKTQRTDDAITPQQQEAVPLCVAF